ncbi:MAG: magnesium transporter CorA family protein [Dehalococcoidia bacterium]
MVLADITTQGPKTKSVSFGKLRWTSIERPSEAETEDLARCYSFHTLDLDDCLNRIQRPKVDAYDDYLFMVFHFPVFNKKARVTTASQVSIFLGEHYLITLHDGNLKPLTEFFIGCETNEETRQMMMGHSSGYLLYVILDRLVTYCFPILNKIGENIDATEEKVFADDAREVVRELSMLRRDVLSFRRITRPQTEVFQWLEKSELPFLKEDPAVYFGDLADHNRRIMDLLDEYKEVTEGLNDTNNTLASFRINQVMRLLTIMSAIILPLTLIASVFGMHLDHLPLSGDTIAFPALMAAMFIIIIGMLAFFRIKRWL